MSDDLDGTPVVVATDAGALRGTWHGGVARFAGVPDAAPPVGDRRFRPPAPVEPWEGERPADAFGPICPQNPSIMDALFGGESERTDEDCLYLNVWTAEPAGRRPSARHGVDPPRRVRDGFRLVAHVRGLPVRPRRRRPRDDQLPARLARLP